MPTTPPNPTVPPVAVTIGQGRLMDAVKRKPIPTRKYTAKLNSLSKKLEKINRVHPAAKKKGK